MIELNENAKQKLFQTVAMYMGGTASYDAPPIYYWYRNVIEALKLVGGNISHEGTYDEWLENSLGQVSYTAICLKEDIVIVITNFVFNFHTIRRYLGRAALTTRGVNLSRRPLFNSPSSQPINSSNIGKGIVWTQYADGSIRLTWKIHRTPLKNQFDKIERRFYRYKDGEYAIGIKNGIRYKLFANDTVEQINENKHSILRLTEEQFKSFLTECIKKIIIEIA